MKLLALLAAAGSMAVFATPAQAAELPASPLAASPIFAGFNDTASPFAQVAGYDDDHRDRRDRRRWRERDRDRDWDDGRRLSRRDRVWRGNDGRYRCKRNNGTTGLVVGAGVGALLGRTVDTRGDRSLGTILGAVGGGLLGREVDRGEMRCR